MSFQVIHSDLIPDGEMVFVGDTILAHPGYIERLMFLNEIRSIVQRGMKAAFPDLHIPRRSKRD